MKRILERMAIIGGSLAIISMPVAFNHFSLEYVKKEFGTKIQVSKVNPYTGSIFTDKDRNGILEVMSFFGCGPWAGCSGIQYFSENPSTEQIKWYQEN